MINQNKGYKHQWCEHFRIEHNRAAQRITQTQTAEYRAVGRIPSKTEEA
jgi:hypothetical protein